MIIAVEPFPHLTRRFIDTLALNLPAARHGKVRVQFREVLMTGESARDDTEGTSVIQDMIIQSEVARWDEVDASVSHGLP